MEFLKTIQPILQELIWPLILLLIFLILKRNIINLLDKFMTAKDFDVTMGPLSIKAKAMHDLLRTFEKEFHNTNNNKNATINKDDAIYLLKKEIKDLENELVFKSTASNSRIEDRIEFRRTLKLQRKDGEILNIETLDLSNKGLAFISPKVLRHREFVKILDTNMFNDSPVPIKQSAIIVRRKPEGNAFRYGASYESAN